MKDIKTVERAVLKVYTKVNPSKIPIEEEAVYEKWRVGRKILLGEKLKMLPDLFRHARLLEVGGGTGENTVLYSQWGADVTLVDNNPIALERARALWKRFGCSATRTVESSLFDLEKKDLPVCSFDFVFCEGVIVHTADPVAALTILVRYVKPGGLLMIAFAEAFGFHARSLQRALIYALAGSEENKIVATAKQYFQEHLQRCVYYGGRTEHSVIYDTYVNPQIEAVNLTEFLDVLHVNKFRYYSGTPELSFPYATEPWNQPGIDYYDPTLNRKWIAHLQRNWLVCGRENDNRKFAEARPDGHQDYDRFMRLEQQIRKADFNFCEDDLAVIQKGYLGIGLHYLVSLKVDQ